MYKKILLEIQQFQFLPVSLNPPAPTTDYVTHILATRSSF